MLAIYRKYRPKKLENLLGQETIVEVLKNAAINDKLAHAYLFYGPRGSGKTTTARLIAKIANCEKRRNDKKFKTLGEPCNKCRPCVEIDEGRALDVIEIDAASNRGIDEIRSLKEGIKFSPTSYQYKVYIIDECHQLTKEAFNALLKTLEEPPDTTIFILATTNLEKVPKTIVSRCVKVNFGIARKDDIIRMLKRIVKNENIQLEENILQMIAQYSEHSFRDAAKILEEISMQKISKLQDVEKYLGIRGKNNLLEIIDQKDLKTTLAWIEEFSQGGGNFKFLIENILEELHEAFLHTKGIGENTIITHLSTQEILLLIKLLMQAYGDLRASPIESLPLEISIAEFYNRRVVDH